MAGRRLSRDGSYSHRTAAHEGLGSCGQSARVESLPVRRQSFDSEPGALAVTETRASWRKKGLLDHKLRLLRTYTIILYASSTCSLPSPLGN